MNTRPHIHGYQRPHDSDHDAGLSNYVQHTPNGDLAFEQFRYDVGVIRAFSPVLRLTLTHIIAEGDLYAVHLRSIMTPTGTVDDIAPTGKVIECTGA